VNTDEIKAISFVIQVQFSGQRKKE